MEKPNDHFEIPKTPIYPSKLNGLMVGIALGVATVLAYSCNKNENPQESGKSQPATATLPKTDDDIEIKIPELERKTIDLKINPEGEKLLLFISDHEKAGNHSLSGHLKQAKNDLSLLLKCPTNEPLKTKETALKVILTQKLIEAINEQKPTDPISQNFVIRHEQNLKDILEKKVHPDDSPETMLLVNSLEIANIDECQ
ncbi:hypothetical protein GF340_03125 [Candidatus Peregrinibacteria bacterium]|nr:hypothetical protein [Candidatus Peregrinibacteria bacterium]